MCAREPLALLATHGRGCLLLAEAGEEGAEVAGEGVADLQTGGPRIQSARSLRNGTRPCFSTEKTRSRLKCSMTALVGWKRRRREDRGVGRPECAASSSKARASVQSSSQQHRLRQTGTTKSERMERATHGDAAGVWLARCWHERVVIFTGAHTCQTPLREPARSARGPSRSADRLVERRQGGDVSSPEWMCGLLVL